LFDFVCGTAFEVLKVRATRMGIELVTEYYGKVKCKFTLEQSRKAQKGRGGIALLFH
jgi:hypothetical protein